MALTWLNTRRATGAGDWLDQGFYAFCNATERTAKGWDVQCGWDKPAFLANPEQRIEQWVTTVVSDEGLITSP